MPTTERIRKRDANRAARAAGLPEPYPHSGGPRLAESQSLDIAYYLARGFSQHAIARALGVHRNSVRHRLGAAPPPDYVPQTPPAALEREAAASRARELAGKATGGEARARVLASRPKKAPAALASPAPPPPPSPPAPPYDPARDLRLRLLVEAQREPPPRQPELGHGDASRLANALERAGWRAEARMVSHERFLVEVRDLARRGMPLVATIKSAADEAAFRAQYPEHGIRGRSAETGADRCCPDAALAKTTRAPDSHHRNQAAWPPQDHGDFRVRASPYPE